METATSSNSAMFTKQEGTNFYKQNALVKNETIKNCDSFSKEAGCQFLFVAKLSDDKVIQFLL